MTAALITLRALRAGATFLQAGNRFIDSAELLVARHHLACLAVHLSKDGEIAHQVEQICGAQHAGHQHLLAAQGRAAVQP
jgi:hypothetical protein